MSSAASLSPPTRAAAHVAWRRELRHTLVLAGPLAGAQLGQIALQTTDVLLLGRYDPAAMAGAGLGSTCFFIPFLFGLGIMLAVSPMAAQAIGAGRPKEAAHALVDGLWLSAAMAAPAGLVLWSAEPLLRLAGQDPRIAAIAATYLRGFLWGFAPALAFVALRGYMAALGHTRGALLVTLGGAVVNGVVVWAALFGRLGLPEMGVLGAGLASSLVTCGMAAVLAVWLALSPACRAPLRGGRPWPRRDGVLALLRVGVPAGGALLLEIGAFGGAMFLMGLLGTTALAAHQIALQCAGVAFMVPLGIGQAATVRVGLAAGARDLAGARRAGLTALAIGLAYTTASALVFWFAGDAIVGLFLPPEDRGGPVATLAGQLLAVAALFQVVDGAQGIAAGALRGLKDTRVPLLLCAIGFWGIGFPAELGLGFAAGLGGLGIWAGLAAGLLVVAVLLVGRFLKRA